MLRAFLRVVRLSFAPMLHLRHLSGPANVVLAIIGYLGLTNVIVALFASITGTLQDIPRYAFVAFSLFAYLLLLFAAAVGLYRKVQLYETPGIDLVFEPDAEYPSSFHQEWFGQNDKGEQVLVQELFRVGVVNDSGKTIEKVRVFIESFTPQGSANLPYPLHVMNDNTPPFDDSLKGFSLHRRGSAFIQVASRDVSLMWFKKCILEIQACQKTRWCCRMS